MDVKMSLRLKTKNQAAVSKIESPLKIDFRADWTHESNPTAWELKSCLWYRLDLTFEIFQFFYLHLTLIFALESEVPIRFLALQVNLFPLSSRVKPEIFNSAILSFGIFSPPKNHSYSSISGFPEPKHCATNVSSWVKESAVRWTAISGLPKF